MPPKRNRSSASTPIAEKGKPAATEVPASAPTLVTNTATTEVSEGELVKPIEGNNISPFPGPQPRSVCDSLGLHLPANVKAKLHKGEFVQLGSLIQPPPRTAPPSMSFALVQDEDKVILGQQPIKLPTINTIEKWTSFFLIYMSVYLEVHTTRAIKMLKYIDTVRSAARQFGGYGWRTYDEQFRLKQALNPTQSWATIDSELWLRFLLAPRSRNFRPSSSNFTFQQHYRAGSSGLSQQQGSKFGFCFAYNRGYCGRQNCQFAHKCTQCKKLGHPATQYQLTRFPTKPHSTVAKRSTNAN